MFLHFFILTLRIDTPDIMICRIDISGIWDYYLLANC